jgi:KDO2-lipid IV(A) lauroyltransferase
MIDQRVSEGIKIPFFKKNALTTTLPAQLSLKFNYEIVPIFIRRNKDDNFEMKIFEPINSLNIENSEKNKKDLSLKLNQILEKMVLKSDSQWIWTHNRWK